MKQFATFNRSGSATLPENRAALGATAPTREAAAPRAARHYHGLPAANARRCTNTATRMSRNTASCRCITASCDTRTTRYPSRRISRSRRASPATA
jgi:hypothetical protein